MLWSQIFFCHEEADSIQNVMFLTKNRTTENVEYFCEFKLIFMYYLGPSLHTYSPMLKKNYKFQKPFLISIFHENDNKWWQRGYCWQIHLQVVYSVFCQYSVTIFSGNITTILLYRERNGRSFTFQSKNTSSRRMTAPAHADRTTIQSGTISGFGGASVGTTSVITSSVRRLTWSGAPMYGRCVSCVATKLETLAGRLYPSYKPPLQH